MKAAPIILFSLALAAAGLAWYWQSTSTPFIDAYSTPAPPPPGATLAVPEKGVYSGAYLDWGEKEDDVTLEGIENFEELTGRPLAIVASSSYWGEQTFPGRNLRIIRNHGAMPLVYWSPWDRPYNQDAPPGRFALTRILKGEWDAYIDHWADSAAQFGTPVFVCFGLEMNGTWFPWSGWFYGAGKKSRSGEDFAGPETYKQAYRYVVDRVRARGAKNILWVFHANNYSYPRDSWNNIARYYPGSNYVDWLGLSVYGKQFHDDDWAVFKPLLDWPYQELCALDPVKPIMLAEWGVGEFPNSGSKAEFITDAQKLIPTYPRIHAAVFWHERWQNADGTYSNLRVDSSAATLEAFRRGLANPGWITQPAWSSPKPAGPPARSPK